MATPEELIDTIITNAIATATTFTDQVDDAADLLLRDSGGQWVTSPAITSGFTPAAIEPSIPTIADTTLTYEANLEIIVQLLSDELASFFATYYPLASDAFDEAQAWLVNVITNGGTGINTSVEAQIWQRARDRIITDGTRVANQITTGYLAKGITMPAGSMLKKIEEARFAQLGETSNQATNIASKQLDIEIQTVRFAVEESIKSRQMAMSAAADYIKAVATAPASALDVANLNSDAQAKMMSAAATWYNARLNRDDLILKSSLANLTAGIDLHKNSINYNIDAHRNKGTSLSAAADAYARTAAASLASLNSIVSTATNSFS